MYKSHNNVELFIPQDSDILQYEFDGSTYELYVGAGQSVINIENFYNPPPDIVPNSWKLIRDGETLLDSSNSVIDASSSTPIILKMSNSLSITLTLSLLFLHIWQIVCNN